MLKAHLCFLCIVMLCLLSCEDKTRVGKPLLDFNFNNSIENDGLAKVAVFGPQTVSYAVESKDTCLDLSLNAEIRKPLNIKFKDVFSLNDYSGFTISVWVKKYPGDPEFYTILSQYQNENETRSGWQLNAEPDGAWSWQLTDGSKKWTYSPTGKQAIDDGKWHNIVVTYNGDQHESSLYFDGRSVAIYSHVTRHINLDGAAINIGIDDQDDHIGENLFNGYIDRLSMWSRVLNRDEVRGMYDNYAHFCKREPEINDHLSVMTWNIWDDGIHDGKYVGVQRIVDIIRKAEVDVVMLQEANRAATVIADELGFNLYRRNESLSILSKFPFGKSHNLFQDEKVACIELQLNKDERAVICLLGLSEKPNINTYLNSGIAVADTVEFWESKTRGKELRFILSEMQHLMLNAGKVPIVIGGGMNSGSHLDWTSTNTYYNGLAIKYPVSSRLESKGFVDTYRKINPNEIDHRGFTYSLRNDSLLKNRVDYIYARGEKLLPIESFLIDTYSHGFPSDHAAVVTRFEWLND